MEQPNSGYIHGNKILSRRRFLAMTGASAAGLLLAGVYGCGDDGGDDEAARPSADDLRFLSLEDAAKLVAAKEVSPVELTEAALARIERLQPVLNTFITITAEQALAQARAAEEEIAAGRYRGALHGIPIAHKDVFDTKGIRTTAGSKIYADRIPNEDATVVARLTEAGAISLGKLNMWEFTPGVLGVNPWYGTVRNPWNVDRLPGGTSAGPAAATSAGLVYGATGTGNAGGIRHPSSFCGVVGLKPTYGRVSKYGAFLGCPSLDCAGPIARNVRDAAIMLQVMAGQDARDERTVDVAVPDYLQGIEKGAEGLRIGVPNNYFWDGVEPSVESNVRKAIADLEAGGAEIRDVSFPQAEAYYTAMRIVAGVEMSMLHADTYPSRKEDYGNAVAAMLDQMQGVSLDDLQAALRDNLAVLTQARSGEADALLEGIDVLAVPTTRKLTLSFEKAQGIYDRADFAEMEANGDGDNLGLFNLTGQPAISVPCGLTSVGVPNGLMMVARQWDEPTLLRAARAYEIVRGPFPAPSIA